MNAQATEEAPAELADHGTFTVKIGNADKGSFYDHVGTLADGAVKGNEDVSPAVLSMARDVIGRALSSFAQIAEVSQSVAGHKTIDHQEISGDLEVTVNADGTVSFQITGSTGKAR